MPKDTVKSAGAGFNPMRIKILDWARDHHLVIHPAIGYDYYVNGVAHFGTCPCDKRRKECPCPESIQECADQGHCKCGLFWKDTDSFKAAKVGG